jgi:predicted HD phosphohydrolase
MTQGTISILFGCHSVIHSYYVLRAWKILYKTYPEPWQAICIFLHDIGHYGLNYLDDYEQKKIHWIKGAEIAENTLDKRC